MTEREAFEKHMLSLNACTRLIRQKDGYYWTTSVQRAWDLWQASRKQALEEAEKAHAAERLELHLLRQRWESQRRQLNALLGALNQCDGCARGLPINGLGIHKNGDEAVMACTADRYTPTGDKA